MSTLEPNCLGLRTSLFYEKLVNTTGHRQGTMNISIIIIKGPHFYTARQSEGLREVLLNPSAVPSMPPGHFTEHRVLQVVDT